jgi:hypothetical protein
MKKVKNRTAYEQQFPKGDYIFRSAAGDASRFNKTSDGKNEHGAFWAKLHEKGLLTPNAFIQMANGQIPDLWDMCFALAKTFKKAGTVSSALQFIPVLQNIHALEQVEIRRFIKNPETRQVLISNDLFEVVLIHWKPGKVSEIHGHARGGCLFKLLHGKLDEIRYTPEESPKLLATTSYLNGSLAYIDDQIAYHQVGNPYGSSAISLHVYVQ